MPVTLKPIDEPMAPAGASIPVEKTLDPGEVVLSNAAADIMAQIISLSKSSDSVDVPKAEIDPSTASLIIGAILIYALIKVAFKILPWILGIGAIILFAKMGGGA